MRWIVASALAAVFLGGCGDDGFDKAQELSSYRVLGIGAAQPELTPASPVTELTVFDFHPADVVPGQERPPTRYTWRVCLVSLGSFVQYECLDPSLEVPLAGAGTTATLDLSAVVEFIPPEQLALGHSVWVKLSAQSGDEIVETVRSVTIGLSEEVNNNPILEGLRVTELRGPDGVIRDGLEPRVGDTLGLELSMAAGSAERYTEVSEVNGAAVERTVSEQLIYTWYSSDGDLDRARGTDEQRENVLSGLKTAGTVRIVVAVRDGRGGFDLRGIDLEVLDSAP